MERTRQHKDKEKEEEHQISKLTVAETTAVVHVDTAKAAAARR